MLPGGLIAEQQAPYNPNYRYDVSRASSSLNKRAMIRSKSTTSQPILVTKANDSGPDFERENFPPSFSQVVQKAKKEAGDQASSHDGLFNPLLTIRPAASNQSVSAAGTANNMSLLHPQSQAMPLQPHQPQTNPYANSEAVDSGSNQNNLSREAISRSFEAKLMQGNHEANSASANDALNTRQL